MQRKKWARTRLSCQWKMGRARGERLKGLQRTEGLLHAGESPVFAHRVGVVESGLVETDSDDGEPVEPGFGVDGGCIALEGEGCVGLLEAEQEVLGHLAPAQGAEPPVEFVAVDGSLPVEVGEAAHGGSRVRETVSETVRNFVG